MKQQSLTQWSWNCGAALLIVIMIFVAYYPSLSYAFQFDDLANITKYFNIRHHTFFQLFFSGTRWISYWLNALCYRMSGFDPYAYRVGSVIIHSINAILVFAFFNLVLSATNLRYAFFRTYHFTLALTTALLFGLHPVQTQTVSYVIQSQLEGLATMSIFCIAILFILFQRSGNSVVRSLVLIALAVVAALSTGTKEIAIVAPLLILLVDLFFLADGRWSKVIKKWPIHGLIGMVIIGSYLWLLKPLFFIKVFGFQMEVKNNIGNIITAVPQQTITPFHYAISQFKVIIHYILMFMWPCNISVEYDWKLVDSFFAPDCLIPFLLLMALMVGIMMLIRYRGMHPIAFGLLWFLIVLAPRSTIIPSPELIVDYKTYMGSPGIMFVIAAALLYAFLCILEVMRTARPARYLFYLVPLFTILLCVPLTRMRNTVWSSGIDFWMNIIINAPGKARAYNNYGVELAQNHNRFADAIPFYQKAIAMDRYYSDPCNNLAVSYAALNRFDEAIYAIKQGLAIYPYYPEGYNNLASFYLHKKEYDLAEQALKIAIQLRPYYGKAYYNLGRLYLEKGDNERGWDCFKACCCNADLDNEIGFEAYAQSSVLCKKYDHALQAYTKLLKMQPHNKEYLFGLGGLYHAQGNFKEAKNIYTSLTQQYPQEGRFWYNLAESLFALADYAAALPIFQKIVQSGSCPAQAVVRLAGCHEGSGRADVAYQILQELKDKLSDQDKKLIEQAQERMHGVYGAGIRKKS